MKTLDDRTLSFLRDIYYAERQNLKARSKLANTARHEKRKQGLMHHY